MSRFIFTSTAFFAMLLLIGAGCSPATTPSSSDTSINEVHEDAVMADDSESMMEKDGDSMMKDDSAMMEKDDDSMMKDDEMAMKKSGSYESYAESKLTAANSGDVVLFFHASWCPSCRALDTSISESLESLPSDLTILKVDYDSATTLRKKYGVTTQHTLVQVDANGNLIQKWAGGNSVNSVLNKL